MTLQFPYILQGQDWPGKIRDMLRTYPEIIFVDIFYGCAAKNINEKNYFSDRP
jgi:hypothetical protein